MKKIFTFLICCSFSLFAFSQSLELTFPIGNAKFMKNVSAPHNIEWTADNITNLKIEYSVDNGSNWITIEETYPAANLYYNWLTPDIISDECIIKISDADNLSTVSQSGVFQIVEQQIFYAKWTTSMGNFRAELRGDIVPVTAQNFMNLSFKGFYTDLIFHRVIPNFMIQDGCPIGNGTGDPGYEFNDEFDTSLRHDFPGVLSMANAGPNTNGSQYFITVVPTTWLDDVHSIFGRVIDSMDVVFNISEVETDANDKPIVDVDIYSISIEEFNPVMDILYPAEGASLIEETDVEIVWNSEFYADFKIEISSDNGSSWETLIDSIPAYYQSIEWTTPNIESSDYQIKFTNLRNTDETFINNFEIRNKPAKYDRIDCYQNIEASTENPENYFSAGSKFRFKVKVLNDYTQTLTGLSAVVSSESEFITFANNEVTFANVEPGQYIWSDQEIEIEISENLPSKYEYNFQIDISDETVVDEPWISKFTIPLVVQGSFCVFDDDNNPDSHGNGNHIAEPGETFEVKINLKNNTYQYLYNSSAKLTSNDDEINIWNNIEGTSGTVYDTTAYNAVINPNSSYSAPLSDFVFDYNKNETYYFELPLIVNTYINEPKGVTFEDGGILIKYILPIVFNSTYPVDIEEVNNFSDNYFEIYPNPSQGSFRIKLNNYKSKNKITIEITDLTGKLIYSENVNSEYETLDVNAKLNSGIYILKISENGNCKGMSLLSIIE